MKNFNTNILLILFIACPLISLGQVKNDLSRRNLKGRVHTTLESEYNPSGNSKRVKEKNLKRKQQCEYDEQGYLNQLNEYNSNNLLTVRREIISDKDGKRILAYDYDINNKIKNIDSFKYDLNGNRVEDILYRPDYSLKRKMVTCYDNSSAVTQSYVYDSSGNFEYGYNFKVDSSGQRLGSTYMNKERKIVGTYIYKYSDFDKQGNWRKCVTFYNDKISVLPLLVSAMRFRWRPRQR